MIDYYFMEGWKPHKTKEEVTVKLKTSERGNPCIYGEVECPFEAKLVIKYMLDLEKQHRYEDLFSEGSLIENHPLDTTIVYLRFKKYIVASGRDFIFLQQVMKFKNGIDVCRWGWADASPED